MRPRPGVTRVIWRGRFPPAPSGLDVQLVVTGCAFVAFRQTFASIWDFRFSHVLLPRTTSLFLRRPAEGAGALTFGYGLGESEQWPVTREGGWGDLKEVTRGAPFDASASGEACTARPCSIHVHQVTLMPASAASSSRRRPEVRRRPVAPNGRTRSRCARTNSPRRRL